MNFIAMDTSINRELARRLQVEPINGSHHVVLVDVDAESYHIMQDDYNKVNLGMSVLTLLAEKPSDHSFL